MPRSKSSNSWLREHSADPYVQRARQQGYRSRASFKLLEIHTRHHLLAPGMRVVELGAAPGGWSQVARELVGPQGRVVAIDLLPMEPLDGISIIRGDFLSDEGLEAVRQSLGGNPVDLVLSDMAPNLSGVKGIDQPRAMELVEAALVFATEVLRPGGNLLVKVFQGEGIDELRRQLKARFQRIKSCKPDASRDRSSELYLLCQHFVP